MPYVVIEYKKGERLPAVRSARRKIVPSDLRPADSVSPYVITTPCKKKECEDYLRYFSPQFGHVWEVLKVTHS